MAEELSKEVEFDYFAMIDWTNSTACERWHRKMENEARRALMEMLEKSV